MANDANKLLQHLKDNIQSWITIKNSKGKRKIEKIVRSKLECISITIPNNKSPMLNYTLKHGNNLIGIVNITENIDISLLEELVTKNKLSKTINFNGDIIYTII